MKKHNLFVVGLLSAFLVPACDRVVTSTDNSNSDNNTNTPAGETDSGNNSSGNNEGGGSGSGNNNNNNDPHKNHTVYHYAARSATCTEPGNLEAWYCYNDHTYYLSNPGGIVIDTESIITPNPQAEYYIAPLQHELEFEGFEWNEDLTYAEAVYVCSHDSNHVFRYNASLEDLTEDEDQPTCFTSGTKRVRATYEDETELKEKEYEHLEHIPMFVKGTPATCTQDGTLDHFVCTRGCGTKFVLNELTNELEIATDLVDHAHGHTPAPKVNENVNGATCLEPGSHDEVIYCAECEIELSREEGIVDNATGHSWSDWTTVTEPDCETDGQKTRTCTLCGEVENETIDALGHSWSEWSQTLAPTCTEEGEESRTCSVCHKVETRPIAALDHSYGAATYSWDENKEVVTSTRVCSTDNTHVEETEAYSYVEPFFTCEGGRSELAGSLTEKEKNGDINLYFKHKANNEYLSFDVDMVLHVVHESPLSTMADNYVIRFDNGCHYAATMGVNTNSGGSYALFYTDLTTDNKAYTVNTPTDNRNLYTDYINGSFEEDYKVFAQDCINVINAQYDASAGELVLTITYFTLVEGYERYLGYQQTFTATVDESDRTNFNYVDSLRLTRTQNASKEVHSVVYIEELTLNEGQYDHDPLNYYSTTESILGYQYESWHNQEIIDFDGHTLQKVEAKEASCTEVGNIEYYRCLSHPGEYYLDAEGVNPTTLEAVTIAKLPHTLTHHEAVTVSCEEDGNLEYYECEVCHKLFLDEDCTLESSASDVVIPASGHDYDVDNITYTLIENNTKVRASVACLNSDDPTHVLTEEAVVTNVAHQDPTEHEPGYDRYYFEFENELFTATYKEVIIPELEHTHSYQHVDAVAPTCTNDGNIEYYTCPGCESLFVYDNELNEYVEVEAADVIDPATGHSPTLVEEEEATCTESGVKEHYECDDCDALFIYDEDLGEFVVVTEEDLVINPKGHTEGTPVQENYVAPTCTESGSYDEVIYCSECGEELSHVEHEIEPTDHNYTVTYTWVGTGNTKVNANYHCENDGTHDYDETAYTYQEPFFTVEGGRSELAGSLTEKEKNGDINLYFKHKANNEYLSFDVDMVLHVVHENNLTSMSENYVIRFDNGCHYAATMGVNTNSGDSYALFYTDLTTGNKAYSVGTPADNRSLFTDYINGSFVEDYKVFARDCINVINAHYDGETGVLTLSITYFTLVEGYERYLGYQQVFTATVGESDRTGFNYVDSLRLTRTQNSNKEVHSVIYIEELTLNEGQYDHDPLNYYSTTETVVFVTYESWHNKEILNLDGHTYQKVEARDATCTEVGNIEYYKCLVHQNEYYLDAEGVTPTTLEAVTIAKLPHTLTHHDAVAPTCLEAGNVEYWTCDVCNHYFLDEEATIETDEEGVVDPWVEDENHDWDLESVSYEWEEDFSKVTASITCKNDASHIYQEVIELSDDYVIEEEAATEEEDGYKTYEVSFESELFSTQTKTKTINALGHTHNMEHHEEDPDSCVGPIYNEYWHCTKCGKYYLDEAGEQETSLKTLEKELLEHELEWHSDDENHWQECKNCDYESEHVAHNPSEAVIENPVAPTCHESGSHDEVIYCEDCGKELDRETIIDEPLEHNYEFSHFEWDGYEAKAVYTCDQNGEEECIDKRDAEITSEVTTEPTCSSTGIRTYTATYYDEATETNKTDTKEEVLAVVSTAHSWVGPTYRWDDNSKTSITESYECEHNSDHTYEENAYTYQTPFFTCEGGRSELAGSLTEKEKNGDINFYFTHKDGNTKLSFDVDMTLRVVHENSLPSMKDNFVIRFDNGCHYKATAGINTNSGDSYALFYTDLTTGNKTYSAGTPTDNRNLYTSYINGSFEEDYKVFAANSVVLIHAEYDGESGELTLTITYFTLVEGYERYLGYKQVFTATVDENDRDNFNIVDSLRITRVQDSNKIVDSKIYIENITRNQGTYDYDVLNYYSTTETVVFVTYESWHNQEIIDVDGHDVELVEAVAPTCTEAGHQAYYKCKNHDNEYFLDELATQSVNLDDLVIEATGHAFGEAHYEAVEGYGDNKVRAYRVCENDANHIEEEVVDTVYTVITAPTCTEAGQGKYTASFTNEAFTTREKLVEIPALGHTPSEAVSENVVNPTCTEEGSHDEVVYCSVCHEELSRETIVDEALGHSYEDEVTAPTCTEAGYTTHTCTVCSEHYDDTEVAALGHDFGEWIVTKEPTCTSKGEETRYCSRCDEYETREVAMIEHNYEEVVTDPTCTEDGYTTHTCTECGDHYNDTPVDALGHAWDDGVVTTPATEDEAGEKTYTCTRCGETRKEVIPPLDHTHTYEDEVVDPTCTTGGYTRHTCTSDKCDHYHYDDNFTEALGHDFGDWTLTKAPTCTEDGEETRCCSRCDAYETRKVDALGHDYEEVVTDPTCTEAGYTTHTCSRCDDSYVDNEVAATGHTEGTPVQENYVAPTCTEPGGYDTVVYCTECGEEISRVHTDLPALGHTYGEWETTKEATCTEDGSEHRFCEVCNDEEVRAIEAHGHTASEAVEENRVDPTCTEKGSHDLVTYCSECNEELARETEEIDALDHDYSEEWTIDEEPTCTEVGSKSHHCSRCDSVSDVTEIEAKGHNWVGAVYRWEHEHIELNYVDECSEGDATSIDNIYTRANHDLVSISGTQAEAAGDLDAGSYKGDLNLCFKNDGDNGTPFHTSIVLRIDHEGDFDNAEDVLTVKVDNGAGYNTTRNTGDDRVIFKSNYTATEDDNSGGYNITGYGDNQKDFKPAEFKHFMQDAVVFIDVNSEVVDPEESHLTITVTYYTMLEEEGSDKYMGYTQVVTATMGGDTNWNSTWRGSVHAVRVIRPASSATSTKLYIESIDNILGTLDYDMFFDKDGTEYSLSDEHNYQLVEAKEATCTEEGNIAYYECSTPGHSEIFSDAEGNNPISLNDVKIPALGHELSHYDATETACDHEGNVEYWCCDRCHKLYLDEDAKVEATSEDIVIDQLDHTYGEWVVTKDSTCSEEGTKVRTCSICGHEDVGVVETKPHTLSEETFLEWYNDGLYETQECTECSYHHHGTNVIPAYETSTSYKATTNSSLANNEGSKNNDGDYNMTFVNEPTSTGGSNYAFTLVMNIKHDEAIDDMKDNFFMVVGNDKIYDISGGTSGSTRAVFYTDLTAKGTNKNDSLTTTVSDNDKFRITNLDDNREEYTPIGASFEDDYCAFTQDCTYVFNVNYSIENSDQPYGNGNYGFLTINVIHYTKVEDYEQYMGYTQTYEAVMRRAESSKSWGRYTGEVNYSDYNTFRIARVKDDFNTEITVGNSPAAYSITEGTLKSGSTNPLFKNTW